MPRLRVGIAYLTAEASEAAETTRPAELLLQQWLTAMMKLAPLSGESICPPLSDGRLRVSFALRVPDRYPSSSLAFSSRDLILPSMQLVVGERIVIRKTR